MLITPRPTYPFCAIYFATEPERSRIETEYRKLDAEWQKQTSITVWMNVIHVVLAAACIGAAALLW